MAHKFKLIFIIISILKSQNFFNADPINVFTYEKQGYLNYRNYHSPLLIRPILKSVDSSKWNLIIQNDFFFNSNLPNMENMGNKWLGKGFAYFTGANISYLNKHIFFTVEPYYYINQNQFIDNINREGPLNADADVFNVLNDKRYYNKQPHVSYGFRESQLFFNYKEIFFGISNTNMWWGPGLHTSLTMTNNSTGFPYFMLGTLKEKRIKNLNINIRYIFTRLKKIKSNPYYTALIWSVSYYSNPIISLGFSRNFLSGGVSSSKSFTSWDAALLPLELFFIDSKIKNNPDDEAHDYWDQTMSGFLTFEFPDAQLKFFIELGTDDHRQNLSDLRSQPEHNSANIIGIRKYGLLNNRFLLGGFEYANIKQSFTHKFRGGGHWWWKQLYEYSTYDGRRWAAHSGSDSDDFYIYFGYDSYNWTFIPGFNYERHGIVSGNPPEVKLEFRLDIRFLYKNYHINIYFEKELLKNVSFDEDKLLQSNIFWFGIKRDLSKVFKKYQSN